MASNAPTRLKDFAKPGYFAVLGFTIAYIVGFTIFFFVSGNTEFISYIPVLVAIGVCIALTLPITKLPPWALWLLAILECLHLAGGGIKVHGDVLYNLVLIPIINQGPNGITIWRFDQLVHPYGSAVAALIIYFFLAPQTKGSFSKFLMFLVIALAAMGVGSINEVLEFLAKVFIPHTDVGGYDNTALDLCSNFVGAVIGTGLAIWLWGRRPPQEDV